MKKQIFIFLMLLITSGVWSQLPYANTNISNGPDLLLNWKKNNCERVKDSIYESELYNGKIITDTLSVCINEEMTYYLSGANLKNVLKVDWIITGGTTKSNHDIITTILWNEEVESSLKVSILLNNLTTVVNTLHVRKKIKDQEGDFLPNSIKFDYDLAGNQIRRRMIYLPRNSNPNVATVENSEKYIKSEDDQDVLYYPNPVKQELNVKWIEKQGQDMTIIEIYDVNGRLISSLPNQSNFDTAVIDFSIYPQGIYELLLKYAGGKTKVLKIVRQ